MTETLFINVNVIDGTGTAPFSGQVLFDGVDVHEHPRDCHRRMAYLSDFFGVYDQLTVR